MIPWELVSGLAGALAGAFGAGVATVLWLRKQIDTAIKPLGDAIAKLDTRLDGVDVLVAELRGRMNGTAAISAKDALTLVEGAIKAHESSCAGGRRIVIPPDGDR